MSSRSFELNLPDLPEVPIRLGPLEGGPPQPPRPRGRRWRDAVSSSLPLLVMALLALGTWWLVKNSPQPLPAQTPAAAARSDPDYTMTGFSVRRFAPDGRLSLVMQGRRLQHFPDDDRIEVEEVSIRALSDQGRETVATARRAVAREDATVLELQGLAQVRGQRPDGTPVEIDSEYLQLLTKDEKVSTHLPVKVLWGKNSMRAGGLDYDHRSGLLNLKGPLRAEFSLPAQGPARTTDRP